VCAEASIELRSVAADFFFNCWYLEIPSDNRIRHVPRCVYCHAQSFRLEAFWDFYVGSGSRTPELHSLREEKGWSTEASDSIYVEQSIQDFKVTNQSTNHNAANVFSSISVSYPQISTKAYNTTISFVYFALRCVFHCHVNTRIFKL
jgi:hypothetical protein